MNITLRLALASLCALGSGLANTHASAQAPDTSEEVELSEPSSAPYEAKLAYADGVYYGGLGLTVAGLGLGVASGVVLGTLRTGDFIGWGSAVAAFGSLALVTGVPMWIVGAVRSDILRAGAERAQVTEHWEIAGGIVTCAGILIAMAGMWLLGGTQDGRLLEAGWNVLAGGLFVGGFIGLPMWAEALRW